MQSMFPFAGGHEGAGVVEAIGPNTPGWEVGDHVVTSFLPSCGRCRWCASGQQNLCDLGANLLTGCRVDGSFRLSLEGQPVAQMCGISTFCEHTLVDVASAVKIDKDLPLHTVCLAGCGVGTGWGISGELGRSSTRANRDRDGCRRCRDPRSAGRCTRRCIAGDRRRPGRAEARDGTTRRCDPHVRHDGRGHRIRRSRSRTVRAPTPPSSVPASSKPNMPSRRSHRSARPERWSSPASATQRPTCRSTPAS